MNKFYFAIVSLIIVSSCSKEYLFKRDSKKIAVKLYSMLESDQALRNNIKFIDFYYGQINISHIIDSLTWADNKSKLDSLLKIKNVLLNSKSFALNKIKKQDFDNAVKRNEKAMRFIDSINVIELLKVTKKYGFPSHDRLLNELGSNTDRKMTRSPHLIFVHTPQKYINKVRKIVTKEYLNGRLGKSACSHIFWHLNGRKGFPFPDDFSHCKIEILK